MAINLRTLASRIVAATPLSYIPVRVRTGPAKGARWTLAPFSYNWRRGGERDLAAGLEKLGEPTGKTCWDFGAHFGIHTVGMAMHVGPDGQVVAFEPDPGAFARLKYHVARNALRNVILFNAAVSSSTGSARLITEHGLGSSMSHFQYEDEKVTPNTPSIDVSTVVPDQLVAHGAIRPPNLIKIDIQGHGARAIQGSMNSIRLTLPIVIFSNHSQWELEGTRTLLAPLGYEVFKLSGATADWDALDTKLGGEAALLVPSRN